MVPRLPLILPFSHGSSLSFSHRRGASTRVANDALWFRHRHGFGKHSLEVDR
jgi:hypothetical protein